MCALSAEQIVGLGFEQVVNAAAVSIVVVDASGKVIHSNERARALAGGLGHEMPADLDGAIEADLDRPIDIFHPDGRRYEHDEWPAVRSLTSGEEIVEEFFYAMPVDERLWIRCYASPVRDPAGEIVAVVLTQTDVTERRREEARLAYLAGLLNDAEDAIVAFDAAWLVTAWNGGAERLYGWTADEMLGRRAIDVVRVELADEQKLDARRAAADSGRWRAEVTAYHKDGTPVAVEAITVAVRGAQGEITGYLAIHRDITERQRMTDALRESRQQTETILESITVASVGNEFLLAARRGPGPARDRLVEAFLPRIEQLARAVSPVSPTPPSQPTEQGVAGLLRALDRYEPTLDTPFWAYASWWVRQAMH